MCFSHGSPWLHPLWHFQYQGSSLLGSWGFAGVSSLGLLNKPPPNWCWKVPIMGQVLEAEWIKPLLRIYISVPEQVPDITLPIQISAKSPGKGWKMAQLFGQTTIKLLAPVLVQRSAGCWRHLGNDPVDGGMEDTIFIPRPFSLCSSR